MQFNEANNGNRWETQYEALKRKFAEAGMNTVGQEYTPPLVVFWNLRGDTKGFMAKADTPGVIMLSGFSPSLLTLLIEAKPLQVATEKEKPKVTPYDAMRAALDNEVYDRIRAVLSTSNEGVFAEYAWDQGRKKDGDGDGEEMKGPEDEVEGNKEEDGTMTTNNSNA